MAPTPPRTPPRTAAPGTSPSGGQPGAGQGGGDDSDDQGGLGGLMGMLGGGGGGGAPDGEGLMAMLLLFAVGSMMGGGEGGPGGGFGNVMKMLMKAMGAKDQAPADLGDLHQANANDPAELAARKEKITNGLLMAGSFINFDTPNPTSEIGKHDRELFVQGIQQLPGTFKFYNEHTGKYDAVDANNLSTAIENDKHAKRASIDVVVNGQTETHYYEQLKQSDRDKSNTGFIGAAWRETKEDGTPILNNGKSDIIESFVGYTGTVNTSTAQTDGTPQSESMKAIAAGRLNPQSTEAAQFTADLINQMGGADKINSISSGSLSMGVSNMHVSTVVAQSMGVNTREIAIEGVGDSAKAGETNIAQVTAINNALGDSNSELYKIVAEQYKKQGVPEDQIAAKVAGLRQDFHEEDALRVMFKGADGQMRTTAEASFEVGIGWEKAAQQYAFGGGNPSAGNHMAGNRQEYMDITSENLTKPEFEGHQLVNIIRALENGDPILQAGQALRDSGAVTGNGTPGVQPGARPGQSQGRTGPQ